MNHGGVFVKAYSNNWLSQFGLYKYEKPVEPPKLPNNQHRKIALYGVLAMAFVLFFIMFVIINQAEADNRQLIVESFTNETSIESSMGHTVLTTPYSSNGSILVVLPAGNDTFHDRKDSGEVREVAEARKQRRIRRLGTELPAAELNENLVLFPSAYLKPPRLGSMRKFSDDYALAESFQLLENDKPRPFGFGAGGVSPAGFTKRNRSIGQQELKVTPAPRHRANYGMVNNIQDVLKQLSSTKNQNYKHFPQHQQQPSEFSNPMYRNHRVKFSGTYRHPRKNGDITTLFGAASKQHELHVSKPQVINNQLTIPSVYMPDPLYNFKPANPSDINLLATDQFRFAPENGYGRVENLPKGMPFSIMLDILPMADGSLRFQRPATKKIPRPNYSNVNFPSYFNNQNFAQVKHAVYNPQQPSEDTYFRSSTSYRRPHQLPLPTMKPGKLMVHLNLYPKKVEASRKYELEKTALDINHLKLNAGETLPDPERHKVDPTTADPFRDYLEHFPIDSYTTTSTVFPLITASSAKGFVESVRSVELPSYNGTFSNEHVAMGRYPPYRQVKRRHQEQSFGPVDPRSIEEPRGFRPAKAEVLSFDANDAI